MKSLHIIAVAVLFLITGCAARINNSKTENVKIAGNCNMCKNTIEEAGNIKGVADVNWDTATKMASITYDTKKTNTGEILRRISLAGYDNEMYLAPDEAYNKLAECCMYDRDNKIKTVTTTSSTQKDTTPQQKVTPKPSQQSQLQPVFDSYFAVKDALVKTNANVAADNAATLLASLNQVKMESLGENEHMAWMKLEKDLKQNAEHIKLSKTDIEHQRDHFALLSKNIYELIKASKLSETIYLQHCPMYNDGKGADWLSKDNTIKNPFYGSKMLSCGKTVETIKQ